MVVVVVVNVVVVVVVVEVVDVVVVVDFESFVCDGNVSAIIVCDGIGISMTRPHSF